MIDITYRQEKLEAEKKENEDTWSKLGDTISQFFTTDKDKEGAEAGFVCRIR